jgi:hypothetical protein
VSEFAIPLASHDERNTEKYSKNSIRELNKRRKASVPQFSTSSTCQGDFSMRYKTNVAGIMIASNTLIPVNSR